MQSKILKISLNLTLGAALVFLCLGCSTAEKISDDSQIKMSEPQVFLLGFEKAVYRSNMKVYGNDLSGMTMIKKSGMNYRVVFISEVGLKYYDLEFSTVKDSMKVHYVINLLDHKPVIDILHKSFNLLFMIFPEKTKVKYYRDSMLNSMQKEYKSGGRKSLYNYDQHFGMVKTIRQRFKATHLSINIGSYDQLAPEKINMNQKNFNLRLEQIEQ